MTVGETLIAGTASCRLAHARTAHGAARRSEQHAST